MPTGCRKSRRKAEGRSCPFSEQTVPLNDLSQSSSPWKSHKELITPSAVWLSYLTTSFYCNVFYGYSHHFQALQLSAHLGASESAPSSAPFVPRHPLGSSSRSLLKATSSERPSLTLFHRSPSLYFTYHHITHSLLFTHVLTCLLFSISESSISAISVHDASLESDTFKGKLKVERPQINGHSMLKEQEEGGHGQSKGTRRRVSQERQARFGSQRPLWTRASALGFVLSTKGSLWGAVDKWHHLIV